VLGALLFLLYTAEIFSVIAVHGANAHFYADDGQLYVNCPVHSTENAISQLADCIRDVAAWMGASRLHLNPQKTQLIWLGSRQQLEKITTGNINILSAQLRPEPSVCDLGVIIDSRPTMGDHVTAVCKAGYYQLRQLQGVVQSLMSEAAKSLINSFISNCLDYCNSLLYGMTDTQLQRLQLVQNGAARLVTGKRCSEHIMPVLRSLHWLPVCQRVMFKFATIVHKCLNGRAPVYLSNDLQYTGQRRTGMRSASAALLEVPRSRTAIGDRSFSIAGPRVWNTLPASVRI